MFPVGGELIKSHVNVSKKSIKNTDKTTLKLSQSFQSIDMTCQEETACFYYHNFLDFNPIKLYE
jgi:hypothetical protein